MTTETITPEAGHVLSDNSLRVLLKASCDILVAVAEGECTQEEADKFRDNVRRAVAKHFAAVAAGF